LLRALFKLRRKRLWAFECRALASASAGIAAEAKLTADVVARLGVADPHSRARPTAARVDRDRRLRLGSACAAHARTPPVHCEINPPHTMVKIPFSEAAHGPHILTVAWRERVCMRG
jgi:hypothetical protein